MKYTKVQLITSLALTILIGVAAQAATPSSQQLKTDHNFNDKMVGGQYQDPNGAKVDVDDDKVLDDLIGVRKNFKDRLKESAQRN